MFHAAPPHPPRAPDFLCVGTQRAGTTWLFHCLDRAPAYAMPPAKELDVFRQGPAAAQVVAAQRKLFLAVLHRELQTPAPDLATLRWHARFTLDAPRDRDWFHRLFAHAGPRCTGDVSPNHFGLDAAGIARAAEWAPGARILILLRDPLDRALSQLAFMRRKGWWGPELGDARLFAGLSQGLSGGFSDYAGALARWEAAFPGRVGVFFLDAAAADPRAFLGQVGAFLGAPIDTAAVGALVDQRPNAAPAVPVSPALRRRLAAWLLPQVAPLAGRFPAQVVPWVRRLAAEAGL